MPAIDVFLRPASKNVDAQDSRREDRFALLTRA
jgi:hypothetical protein